MPLPITIAHCRCYKDPMLWILAGPKYGMFDIAVFEQEVVGLHGRG